MKDVGCQTYTNVSQSYQWAFTSSTMSIQRERSNEGGLKLPILKKKSDVPILVTLQEDLKEQYKIIQ